MKKILSIFGLTALLCCCGVQSDKTYRDLQQQIVNSGTVVFLEFLERVRSATEKLVRDDQFRKSRISIQESMKAFREVTKPLKDGEIVQDRSAVFPERIVTLMAGGTFGARIRQVFDECFSPYLKIYSETFKNDTMADIWKEVDSYYLPGAPPVYSKPVQFLSHLLAKAVVKSRLVNMLQAGVNTVVETGKIDFNQIHETWRTVMDQIRQKAIDISVLEKQKEKNDFLVSLRTAAGLIVFYFDKNVENIESTFSEKSVWNSLREWDELTKLKNTSEKYHVLLDPNTRLSFINWIENNLFFTAVSERYCSVGEATLGSKRFNLFNGVVLKSVFFYAPLVYEKLSEVGFEIDEINRFLHKVQHIMLSLEGVDFSDRQTYLETLIRHTLASFNFLSEKEKNKDNHLLLPVRVFRTVLVELWDLVLRIDRYSFYNETEFQQTQRKWIDMRNVIINELVKSNTFTRMQLEEAPKNLVPVVHQTLDKLKDYTDLVDGFDERIDPTFSALENSMYRINIWFNKVWELLLK